MRRLNDMSINRKLTMLILASCITVLLLAGAVNIFAEIATTRKSLSDSLAIKADLLGRNSAAPLAFHRPEDADELSKTLSSLAADPHVILACVYDKNGNLFSEYVRKGQTVAPPASPPPLGKVFRDGYLEVARSVRLDGNDIGTIYLQSDLDELYSQIEMHAAIILVILVGSIILAIGVSPRLRQPIAEPILVLTNVARRVAQDRDYAVRARKTGTDEIGLLTDAFNQMLDEIETTHISLKTAKETAEAASQAKDQFLAVLSHELRTPLTPVLLTISLLQRNRQIPAEIREDIDTIRRHVELEARLIDDMLDVTRITRGKLQLHFESVDIHKKIQDAIAICLSERMSDVHISLEATRHHVSGDAGRLTQVFWNLMSNARKFTPPGSAIRIRSNNPSDGKIHIEISDTGVGIAPEMLPRIFNAFEQADASFVRQFGGLGLGLTIVKALVEAHRGSITAHSEGLGKGSTFAVTLDTIEVPSTGQATTPAKPTEPAASAGPLRVLLVEDHPM
ncbi:MAG TPA: ATP-binding protein, partial [Tepidisphaeraceae bacterium]|nr:ATP-binding protein [Tepidisphaeraceae bacterium]